jgi:hypothetical protein
MNTFMIAFAAIWQDRPEPSHILLSPASRQ